MRSPLTLAASAAALLVIALPVLAYEAVSVSEGGTIKGRVVYAGPSPTKRRIILTKDKEACGTGVREVDQILLGPDNEVREAIIYLRDVAKGKAWEKPAKTPAIENSNCEFRPHVQVVPAGDVEIVNSDPVLHNTHGFLDKRTVFNVALPYQGLRIEKSLRQPGLVRVECDAHGWMLGWIYVADNPYYAITAKDGTFVLTNVPLGSYTLVTWHEYTGAVETPVTAKAKDAVAITVELKR